MPDTATAEVEQIEVTQADRELYKRIIGKAFAPTSGFFPVVDAGKHDATESMQLIARHRIAALAHLKAPQPYVKVEDE